MRTTMEEIRRRTETASNAYAGIWLAIIVASFLLGVMSLMAYLTHIWWAVKLLMSSDPLTGPAVVLAIIGLFPPMGVMHGILLWF